MLSLIFLVLASMCNSVMDTTSHHYSVSIFSRYNPLWWNSEISWKNKYINGDSSKGRVKWILGFNKPVQITDAFHFFKMWMIIFICLSIISFDRTLLHSNGHVTWYTFSIALLIYGVIWNSVFSLMYDKILKK